MPVFRSIHSARTSPRIMEIPVAAMVTRTVAPRERRILGEVRSIL